MKRLCLFILMVLMIPALVNAKETMILYDQYQTPCFGGGQQISKSYYIKGSLKVDPKNTNLLQVKTYTKVTSPEGIIEYLITYQINCATQKYTTTSYWSTGYGFSISDLMVDGKWCPVLDFEEMVVLMNLICQEKRWYVSR